MRIFDTITQELKYKVIKEVAKMAFENRLSESYYTIPRKLVPEDCEAMRCCIYKDRAIVEEMVRMVIGAHKTPSMLDVLNIACDECPIDRYTVSEGCRGCISHKCIQSCPVDAIKIGSNKKAKIDKSKCIECGKCFKACPYSAIREQVRPCVKACKISAIKVDSWKKAVIDHDKCVSCGACMIRCPFGAIQDRSFILDVIDILKEKSNKDAVKIYAIIAPSIASQYKYATVEQIVSAILKLGFDEVVEVALGADVVAIKDAKELIVKKKLFSSCCPSFVKYVKNAFPKLEQLISENVSPMAQCAKMIKEKDNTAKVVFIGPCISKKAEAAMPDVKPYVDAVITFEELQALIDSKDIIVDELVGTTLENASFYGRIFARAGGVIEAVNNALKVDKQDISLTTIQADGLDMIKVELLKLAKATSEYLFVEGMACSGGCINGGGCVSHSSKNAKDVDDYGKLSSVQVNELINDIE